MADEDGTNEILLCGRHVVRAAVIEGDSLREIFSYRLAEAPELDVQQRECMTYYHSTDEVKPAGAGRLLITSVGGCVALLDRASRKLNVVGWANGVHSAEILPGGLVVAAVSSPTDRGGPKDGHRLALYDPARPFEELWQDSFLAAHGAVWDGKRQLLWALGREELRAYRLENSVPAKPRLMRETAISLPSAGGHDLQPVPGTPFLVLSVHEGVLLFDRDTKTFQPHPLLKDMDDVKGVSVHPRTGRIAVVQAEAEYANYANHIHLYKPQTVVAFSGPPVYKARWNCR